MLLAIHNPAVLVLRRGSFGLSTHLYKVSLFQMPSSFDLGLLTRDIPGIFTISSLLADPNGGIPQTYFKNPVK